MHSSSMLHLILHILQLFVEISLSLLLSLLIFPILLISFVVNELFRLAVSLALHLQYGGRVTLVPDGADNVWHYKKPGNNRMCIIALFSDTPVVTTLDLMQERRKFQVQVIEKTLPNRRKPYAKLEKTFTTRYGYHCFRNETIDIDQHVRYYETDICGNGSERVFTEQELLTTILPTLSQDMDESKPQWEEVIVSRVRIPGRRGLQTVRCFRYHHGYMDGASANLMFANCLFDQPPEEFPYVINPLKDPPHFSRKKVLLLKILCALAASFTLLKILYKAANTRGRFVTKAFTGKRVFGMSEKLDSKILRKIRLANGVSAPTVLATATGSTLRKMMEKFRKGKQRLDSEVVLGMITAILPYDSIAPRNKFTLTHFTLPTSDLPWPQRMKKVNDEFLQLQWDLSFFLTRFMFAFFGRFPVGCIQGLMEDAGNPISFSNVPMTSREVSLCGSVINHAAGFPPLVTNTGLGIIIMRYGNHVQYTAIADEACLSKDEMDYFMDQVVKELRSMADDIKGTDTVPTSLPAVLHV